jgi:hypothetical protein
MPSHAVVLSQVRSPAIVMHPLVYRPNTMPAWPSRRDRYFRRSLLYRYGARIGSRCWKADSREITARDLRDKLGQGAVRFITKTEEGRATVMGMQTLKRIGQPDDVASVIAFLVSDEARWRRHAYYQCQLPHPDSIHHYPTKLNFPRSHQRTVEPPVELDVTVSESPFDGVEVLSLGDGVDD